MQEGKLQLIMQEQDERMQINTYVKTVCVARQQLQVEV